MEEHDVSLVGPTAVLSAVHRKLVPRFTGRCSVNVQRIAVHLRGALRPGRIAVVLVHHRVR